MNAFDTFRTRTHGRSEGPMPTLSIGLNTAQWIADNVRSESLATLAGETETYLPAVMAEIDSLRAALRNDPAEVAKRALLFGISTPNRDEVHSLLWAMAASPEYGRISPRALTEVPYFSLLNGNQCRIGLREILEKSIADAYAQFPAPQPHDLQRETLQTLRGVGPKVASMIAAVSNPDAEVWTVDLWHGRQLLWASGAEYRVKVAVKPNAYGILERLFLNYAQAFFPDYPVWAIQWATWNVCDGRHNPHDMLWRDLA